MYKIRSPKNALMPFKDVKKNAIQIILLKWLPFYDRKEIFTLFRMTFCFLISILFVLLLPVHANAQDKISSKSPLDFNGEELTVLTWADYINPQVVERFEKKYNAKIKFHYYESNDTRTQILTRSEGRGYDVILACGSDIENYSKRGWLESLSNEMIPNRNHIHQKWAAAFPKSEIYGVPYFWGTIGIAYRKDLVKSQIKSWKDLLNPPEELRGKIIMNNHSRDLIGVALKSLGYSSSTNNADELKAAEQVLQKQMPFVRAYSYVVLNEKSELVTGELLASMIYSGDVLMLRQYNQNIEYVTPEEGSNIWVDFWTIATTSPRKKLAATFINFLNVPEEAASLAKFVNYATPNKSAESLLPKDYFDNKIIYPDQDFLEKSEYYKSLEPRKAKLLNSIMSQLISAHNQVVSKKESDHSDKKIESQ